jgi:hypothetical protein
MSTANSVTKKLTNYDSKDSFGSKLRTKRIVPLLRCIEAVFKEKGQVNIIDMGGTENYWRIVPMQYLEDHKVKITIVNIPGANLPESFGPFTFKHGDGCQLTDFADKSFDIAHSNSVIEHVGDWDRMVKFADELKRVANKYYIQTPNYWFPVEPHCMTPFFHWLPKPTRVWLIMNFALGHWQKGRTVDEAVRIDESARLLDRKMFTALFGDGKVTTERFFLLPKSFSSTFE